jgi:hypothetical protein
LTNKDAMQRVQQKVNFLSRKVAENPDERKRFWEERDLEAFQLALAALEYVEAVAAYEASQGLTE